MERKRLRLRPHLGKAHKAYKEYKCWACERNIYRRDRYYSDLVYVSDGSYSYSETLRIHPYCKNIVDNYGYMFRDEVTQEVRPVKYWEGSDALKRKDLPIRLKDYLRYVMNFDV